MQFQDITRQKLERVHKPALSAAADSLSLLSHETQALVQRDLYRAVRAYAQSALKPRMNREGLEAERSRLDALGAPDMVEGGQLQTPEGNKVEIF
jgi:hypothetical protein